MAAGKSTIGHRLAKMLKVDFYDSDREIEQATGADIPWIFDIEGEAGFRARETRMLDDLTQKNGIVLATGGGSVVAAENRDMLSTRGIVIYLVASLEQQRARTEHNNRRPMLQGSDVDELLLKFKTEREPLYKRLADVEFQTNKPVAVVVDAMLDWLAQEGYITS